MALKHRVEIEMYDQPNRLWRAGCTCGVVLKDFSAPGLAEKAIEEYHKVKGWRINKVKVKGD